MLLSDMSADENYRLLQEIEANRAFILTAYLQNPQLLEQAEDRIKLLLQAPEENQKGNG